MKLVVPDASVAAKWLLPRDNESLIDEAFGLLELYALGRVDFLVPGMFWAEIGNIFWKAARLRRWSSESAIAAAGNMLERKFPTVADSELLADALSLAVSSKQTVYDSLYVAIALRFEAEMITADERLANSVAAWLPVKWLGGMA